MESAEGGRPGAIGVDVGGTKINVGLVDRAGRVLASERILTAPTASALTRTRLVADGLADMARTLEVEITGVGLGVPELVDPHGEISSRSVIGWSTLGIRETLGHIAPVTIDADVRASALAEAWFGAGIGLDSWLYVNLGTGISHCQMIAGGPVLGAHGRAILSGSTRMTVRDRATSRLVQNRVEDEAGARAIVARYQEATGRSVDMAEWVMAIRAGDGEARRILDDAVTLTGSLVANLVDLLDPSAVVIGGGLATIPEIFDGVVASSLAGIWASDSRAIPFVPGRLGPAAGLIGAASMTTSDRGERRRSGS